MLQSAKNLVKFVSKMNPSDDTTLRLAIGHSKEIDCLFFLNKGNGREMFAKLMACPTINLTTRGTDDKYIDLIGKFDGYSVDVTFLDEPNDIVELERADPKAGYPELAKCSSHWNYMTPEEWDKFIENINACSINDTKGYLERNDSYSFRNLIGGAFAWDETKEGSRYWIEISDRTSPIV
jgi:hypothetical protein